MTLIAGLAALNHPLVETVHAIAVSEHFVAIPDTSKPCFTEHGLAERRYALAANWCAEGAFIPFSWRDKFGIELFHALDVSVARSLRDAIEACEGRVELAFQLDEVDREAALEPSRTQSAATTGRAFLHALRGSHESRRGFVARLRESAATGVFAVSMVAMGRSGVSGLLRCALADVDETKARVEAIAAAIATAGLSITGPLPPFGAGVEIAAIAGLARNRSAA